MALPSISALSRRALRRGAHACYQLTFGVLLLLLLVLVCQVHDFWHVLTGCHTNVFGELALKALEFVQVSDLLVDSQ